MSTLVGMRAARWGAGGVYLGMEEGLRELFDAEYPGLVRTAVLLCGDRGRSEEIVQEAFARAAQRWSRLRRYERPGAWLRLVVVRLAVRSRERAGRERLTGTVPEWGVWDPPPVDARVLEALTALSGPQRDCVVLHHVEDLSVAETAEALGMAEGTVRSHLHRGRRTLADLLGDVTAAEDRHG